MKTETAPKIATSENIGGACMSGKPLTAADERKVAAWVGADKAAKSEKKQQSS